MRSLKEHLTACARCREFAEGLRASQATLRSLGAELVDVEALQLVRARVLSHIAASRLVTPGGRVWPCWRVATAAAFGGLLILMGVSRLHRHSRPPAPAAPREVAAIEKPAFEGSIANATRTPRQAAVTKAPVVRRRIRRNKDLVAGARSIQQRQPLVVKLLTDDPNVVIYWLVD